MELSENGLQVKIQLNFAIDADVFEKHGISVNIINIDNKKAKITLTPSAVKAEDIPKAVEILKSILTQ